MDLQRAPEAEDVQGEGHVSAEAGSNGDTDIMDEDLLRTDEGRATGFVGKGSELQWIRRLQRQLGYPEGALTGSEGPYGPPGDNSEAALQRMKAMQTRQELQERDFNAPLPTSTSSFYLDDDDVDVDYTVDPYELPPMDTAQRLVDSYLNTVQDSFPILSRSSFTDNFRGYYQSARQGLPLTAPNKWLAILNLVFAIGAKYSHLTEADWRADDRDHLIYQSRAHILGLYGSLLSKPDLMQVQFTGLLAFYLLVVGRVNRAWIIVGIALRYAQALGLHLRNEDRTFSTAQKEMLIHMWWGICCLEGILSIIIGRPSLLVEDYCSVPLPLSLTTERLADPTQADQSHEGYRVTDLHRRSSQAGQAISRPSNAASFLKSTVQVVLIAQRAMAQLYSAKVVTRSWKQVQQMISALCNELEVWSASLPYGLDFTRPDANADFRRERLILNMKYIECKLLITRPCLCRLDSRITNQTKASDNFNKKTALMCVKAAKDLTDILPDLMDSVVLYQTGPWWTLVHSLMQALTVLLLEMSYGTVHLREDSNEVLSSAKKLIRCLRTMKRSDPMAERAYSLAFGILQKLAPRIKADLSDLLSEDAACSEEGTVTSAAIHSTINKGAQDHSFSTGVGEHQSEQGIPASGYSHFHTGHASMSARTPVPTQEYMRPSGAFPADLTRFHSLFNPTFTTHHDENNPVHSSNFFSSMDAATPDVLDENFSL
ncbi:hypothetical protein BU23DRAFT_477342 [Bimuria novae-zelandiae CBS 107.79]|uniref:Xylanolytic transcriptional activator regulatory domain-containing protein n=1 Tax=Bimuria novae-zelandiae CBS 107.79 TaxID=1447943 RepID=A0A6A5UW14_9PLEO|nr:hypothetical protein BU23DRAFT_477342 [Bimuria novae-zelandiae CBS 107.79]